MATWLSPPSEDKSGPILGVLASGAYGADLRLYNEIVRPALCRGWQPAITLTPTAWRWAQASEAVAVLRSAVTLPVRGSARLPTEPKPYPMPSAFVFCPATANSIAKLALGIADNQALTAAVEALGARLPFVLRPQADANQRAHPAFARNMAALRDCGVTISDAPPESSWVEVLDALGVQPEEW
ncbi:MAG: flavoprotein [Sciscionella sp.]